MPKIKVIHLVDDLRCGGLESVVAMLARFHNKEKFDVEVWCVAAGGEVADQLIKEGKTVRILGIRNYYNPFNILKLAALFREHKPDVIHTHIYFASTISRIAAQLTHVPVVITHMHNVYLHYNKRNLWIDRLLSHISDQVVCCSKAVEDFVLNIEKVNPGKVVTIYNGIDMDRFDIPFDRENLKQSLNIQNNEFVIINVAFLMEKKGHKYLFEAVVRLKKEYPNIKCLVVGYGSSQEEGDIRNYPQKLGIDDRVVFLGLRNDVPELLRIANVFVLSSLTEGLPLALIEAMAAGLPIVSTHVGGVGEVVEDQKTAILVKPQDPEAIYKAIKSLIDNPPMGKKLGEAAFAVSRKKFHCREMIRQIEKIYEEHSKDIGFINKETYEKPQVVRSYAEVRDLQKPEESILNILKGRLPSMKMLDIGVGAGRTTLAFAPLVNEYVGVDYSQSMIEACRNSFPHSDIKASFALCDARRMTMFPDNTFDFILFSYNGIDYMPHEDRLKALNEIRRVAKPGGLFCFSTHNILCIEKYLRPSLSLNLFSVLKSFQRYCQIKSIIHAHMGVENIPYSVIRDGAEGFRIETYYIHPHEQIRHLKEMKVSHIRIFTETTGEEVTDHTWLAQMKKDRWFYFLCTINK